MKYFSLLLIAFCLVSCGGSTSVFVDYAEDVDFSKYTTFNFFEPDSGLMEDDDEHVMDAIEDNLIAKGFESQLIAKSSVLFYVDFYDAVSYGNENPYWSGNYSNAPGAYPLDSGTVIVSLTVEFVDGLTNELYWEAVVEKKITNGVPEEKRAQFFKELIDEALAQYPPEQNNQTSESDETEDE